MRTSSYVFIALSLNAVLHVQEDFTIDSANCTSLHLGLEADFKHIILFSGEGEFALIGILPVVQHVAFRVSDLKENRDNCKTVGQLVTYRSKNAALAEFFSMHPRSARTLNLAYDVLTNNIKYQILVNYGDSVNE